MLPELRVHRRFSNGTALHCTALDLRCTLAPIAIPDGAGRGALRALHAVTDRDSQWRRRSTRVAGVHRSIPMALGSAFGLRCAHAPIELRTEATPFHASCFRGTLLRAVLETNGFDRTRQEATSSAQRKGCVSCAPITNAVYWRRWVIFGLLAIIFFVMALSNDVYNLASPPAFTWHVLVRKIESIVAFAVIGAAFVWASDASMRRSALLIAVYSGAIEVGQYLHHSTEGLWWNAFDVVCGAIGGALGAIIPWVRVR